MVHEKRKSSPCVGSQISFAKMRGKCEKGVVKVSNILASVVRFLLNKCFVLDSTRVCTFLIFEEIDYTFDGFEDIRFYVKQFVRLTE